MQNSEQLQGKSAPSENENTQQLIQLAIEHIPEAVFWIKSDGNLFHVNQAACHSSGYSREELLSMTVMDIAPDLSLEKWLQHWQNHWQNQGSDIIETCQRRKDGSIFPVEVTLNYVEYKGQRYNCAFVRDISDRQRLEAEREELRETLQKQRQELDALNVVTANAISTLNLEELLNILLKRMVELLGAEVAVILLREDKQLRVRASIGIPREISSNFAVKIEQGFAGKIAATQKPLYLEDIQIEPFVVNPLIRQFGIRSMLGVPLKRNGTLVGVLHVDWFSIHPFSDRELHLLEITAERCTMAILNAQLYEQTKQLQERLQLQLDRMPIGCILMGKDFRILDWNPAAEKIFGFSKQEVLDRHPNNSIIPPEDRPFVEVIFQRLAAGEVTVDVINKNITKDGRTIICEWHNTSLKAPDGTIIGYLSMAEDVTERQHAEQALRKSERRYSSLAKALPVGICRTDAVGNCIYINEKMSQMTGLSPEAWMGIHWLQAAHPEDRADIFAQWQRAVQASESFEAEFRCQRSDGSLIWVCAQAIAETNEQSELTGYVSSLSDITEHKQVEKQLRVYAFYDSLTGLPNRALFLNHVQQFIDQKKQTEIGLFAVLFLDLNRFQLIKHSLGHLATDQLLIKTAWRLNQCLLNVALPILDDVSGELLKPSEIREFNNYLQPPTSRPKSSKFLTARIGLDEFAILLTNLQSINDATRIANQIHQELQLPFNINDRDVFVNASLGIAMSSVDYERSEDFLRAADTAMYTCKQQGNAPYAVFDPGWYVDAVTRLQMETDLRRVIERAELRVYYQPILSLTTNRITGFEALVRWQHPIRGFISPIDFIPLAEETGLINQIDRWVLQEACRQMAVWQREFPQGNSLTLSVNLSSLQLAQLGLIERLDRLVRETGIDGSSLKLEITESRIMENATVSAAMLTQLKSLGIQLSIDDFGTGYSSLARLHQLPIDTLKIDGSFISQMSEDSESFEIVRTIITLAHILDMDVIAEGVETAEQVAQLQSLQCEYGQGYIFSKPIPSEAVWALLHQL